MALLAAWFRTSNLQNYVRVHFCYLNNKFVVISYNNPVKLRKKVKSLSRVQLFATPWNVAHQGPPSIGFSRQKYWIGLPFPIPGDLSDPGIQPGSPALQADALPSEPPGNLDWGLATLGEACGLKLPTLARHHPNHFPELFYNRRSW